MKGLVMEKFVVMTAAACMPGSCKFGIYKKVAVVETDGVVMPKQINPKHNAVKSFRHALAEAREIAAKLNAKNAA